MLLASCILLLLAEKLETSGYATRTRKAQS